MAGICSICGKKYSWILQDFPLSNEFPETRICAKCSEKIAMLYESTAPEKETEIIQEFETYLSTSPYPEVREFLTETLNQVEHKVVLKQQEEEQKQQFEEQVQTLLLTTGNSFDGYKVEKYIDVICLEVIFKNSFLNQLEAGLDTFFNSFAFSERELTGASELIANAREYIMKKFRKKAVSLGANAILGIDLENSFGSDVVRVSVSGTAVKIRKLEE